MVLLGVTLGFVCRSDCHPGKNRCRGREFESGDRYPHERHSGFQLGIAIFTTTGASIAAIDKKAWIMLVLSGLATGLSWLCYFRALQVGEVSKPIDKSSVVVAIGLGMLILREKLDLREGIGAALIVLGALVLALK